MTGLHPKYMRNSTYIANLLNLTNNMPKEIFSSNLFFQQAFKFALNKPLSPKNPFASMHQFLTVWKSN